MRKTSGVARLGWKFCFVVSAIALPIDAAAYIKSQDARVLAATCFNALMLLLSAAIVNAMRREP